MTDPDRPRDRAWRRELSGWLTGSAARLDDLMDTQVRRLRRRLGREGVPAIQPYIGYTAGDEVRLHGRVLTNVMPVITEHPEEWWRNVAHAYQRFASDEVPGVTVEARVGGGVVRAVTDQEGYFRMDAPHDGGHGYWTLVPLAIVDDGRVGEAESAVVSKNVRVPERAEFVLVSDVDDTVLHTGATSLLRMARRTLFANARTRAPLTGVGTLYQLLHRAGALDGPELNPAFYVSSSPWNLFDLLEDFIELNDLPLGPLLLRDLGFDTDIFLSSGHDHKLEKIRGLVASYETLPFVLFGDSGQEDARLYAEAAVEFGSRIQCAFIRDVDPERASSSDERVRRYVRIAEAAGVPMYLVRDSLDVAEIAADMGLLPKAAVPLVRDAVAVDARRD